MKINDQNQIKQLCENRASAEEEMQVGQALYFMKDGFWCRKKTTKDGDVPIRLCNFLAAITEETIIDDGLDQRTIYAIEGRLHGTKPLPKLEVEAGKFPGMAWVSHWGMRANLEPGQTVKDQCRHAIQSCSREVKTTTYYGHTGWREIDGKMLYLHAGGAIGRDNGVSVKLPWELSRYTFHPAPPKLTNQAKPDTGAIDAALSFLDIGKRSVTLPLWSFIFLAPLTTLLSPMPNFSFFLHGQSGTFKSSLAVLALNYFGSFPGIENLSNFDDSDGALEMRGFVLKDTMFVIDDLHPSSNRTAAQQREGRLQRAIRNFGNRTARARLNTDLSEKRRYPPRGLLLVTGEELAGLESTVARLCTVEIGHNAIEKQALSTIQARTPLLSMAMRSYIEWIAAHIPEIVSSFPERFRELRAQAVDEGMHGRLPEQVAYLYFALMTVAEWLVDSDALSETGAGELVSEGWEVFKNLSAAQQRRIQEEDPVAMFIEVIHTLLLQNTVRMLPVITGGGAQIGAGEIIGWYDDEYIFLNPTSAWHSLQRFCIMEGTHFPFSRNTFFQMLKTRGIIHPSHTGENTIVKKIGGKPCRVLKIIGGGLYEKTVTSVTS